MTVKIKELTIKATFVDRDSKSNPAQQVRTNNNSRIQSNILHDFYNDDTKKRRER